MLSRSLIPWNLYLTCPGWGLWHQPGQERASLFYRHLWAFNPGVLESESSISMCPHISLSKMGEKHLLPYLPIQTSKSEKHTEEIKMPLKREKVVEKWEKEVIGGHKLQWPVSQLTPAGYLGIVGQTNVVTKPLLQGARVCVNRLDKALGQKACPGTVEHSARVRSGFRVTQTRT